MEYQKSSLVEEKKGIIESQNRIENKQDFLKPNTDNHIKGK